MPGEAEQVKVLTCADPQVRQQKGRALKCAGLQGRHRRSRDLTCAGPQRRRYRLDRYDVLVLKGGGRQVKL